MHRIRKGIKLYRKFRYRKGFGVHSPFVYNLITKVIEEKSPYYIFEEIEKIRHALLINQEPIHYFSPENGKKTQTIGQITRKEIQHAKYGALLFRIVNQYQCKNILHIGASTGIISLYLAAPFSDSTCIAIERRNELVSAVQVLFEKTPARPVQFLPGSYSEMIRKAYQQQNHFDLIFIDTAYDPEQTRNILQECVSNEKSNTILLIDGIHRNKKINDIWQELKNNPKMSITIDLYALGIVFFNYHNYKQHYKTYFDDGKKQIIHPNRRRGFHFFSRRKKSLQKSYPTRSLWNNR